MSLPVPTIPTSNILALYRRFTCFSIALRRSNFDSYCHRYQITQTYPPVLHDIINLNTDTIYKTTYLRRNGVREGGSNPHFPPLFFGWRKDRWGFQTTLAKFIPIFFRSALHDSQHSIYQQSKQHHGNINQAYRAVWNGRSASGAIPQVGPPQSQPAEPLSRDELYTLGVRTLYFLERAAGLRPHVFYVEYAAANATPTKRNLNPLTNVHTNPNVTYPSFLASLSHSTKHPKAHVLSSSPEPSVPFVNFLKPLKPNSHPGRNSSPSLSSPSSFSWTRSDSVLSDSSIPAALPSAPVSLPYTNIANNRSRRVTRVIPLSSNPNCLSLLPADKQTMIYTIHQYFSELELELSRGVVTKGAGPAVKLTKDQKKIILSQLDPSIQDFLTNQFICNSNHQLEERLLHCINKANYCSLVFQNTVPLIIQRAQLVNLIKELQILIL